MDTGNTYWSVVSVDDNNVVHKDGDETIGGHKVFDGIHDDDPTLSGLMLKGGAIRNTIDSSSTNYWTTFGFNDHTGEEDGHLGMLQHYANTSSPVTYVRMGCYKFRYSGQEDVNDAALVTIGYDFNGNKVLRGPSTSETRTNGDDVLTRDWIPKDTRIVHTTGDETISGHKSFRNYIEVDADTQPSCVLKARNMERNVAPSSGLYNVFVSVYDKKNQRLGGLYHKYFPSKRNCISIITDNATVTTNTFAEVSLTYDENGTMIFSPASDNNIQLGTISYRWKQLYVGTATINTSDARLKTEPEKVPDNILDAWSDVDFVQFQFKDAIAEKGQSARIHNGIIAQNISSVFESRGIDPSRYGLFCYDSWEATSAGYDQDGNLMEEARPAGDMYSLRYEEALCMEAAYNRREVKRLKERLSRLEERLAS